MKLEGHAALHQLRTAYKKCLSLPYCSASTYYRIDGGSPPQKYGTDCVGQVRHLKAKLQQMGIQSGYIEDVIVGRHRSLLCKVGDYAYYMSPYLMHHEPILLTQGMSAAHSLPVGQTPSSLYIHLSADELAIKKVWCGQHREDNFKFDLGSVSDNELTTDEWITRLIHPEQKTLSLRIIDPTNNDVLHYVVDTKNPYTRWSISPGGISRSKSEGYKRVLNRMALLLQSSPADIVEFIDKAYHIRSDLLLVGAGQPCSRMKAASAGAAMRMPR